MIANRTKLALRRKSIRTLTADELRFAHGGEGAPVNPGSIRQTNSSLTGTSIIRPSGTAVQVPSAAQLPSGGR